MFKGLARKPSSEDPPQAAPESDDDISVTSTVDAAADPDQEFEVEDILYETENDHGDVYFLVKWTGFRLHECTWEPLEHIGSDLREMWKEQKQKIAKGELVAFELSQFHAAQEEAKIAKAERHRRRNAKRKKKGLPLTRPLPESEEESSDEASEDQYVAEAAPGSTARRSPQKQKSAKLSKLHTSSAKPSGVLSPTGNSKTQGETRRTSLTKPTTPTDATLPNRPSTLASSSRVPIERPSATGYQGTARKLPDKPSLGLGRNGPSPIVNRLAGNSLRSKMTAKKSSKAPAGNIFTSGKTKKPRPSLKDIQVDPARAKSSKQHTKWSTLRKLEKASRDKEDLPPDPDALVLFDPSTAGKRTSSLGSNKEAPHMSPNFIISPQVASPTEMQPMPGPKPVPEPRPGALKSMDSVGGPPNKRRKSVRFDVPDDDEQMLFVQEPEPMDVDMPVFTERNSVARPTAPPGRARLHSPPPLQTPLPVQSPPPRLGATQSSEKQVVLGNIKLLGVYFNGLPAEPEPTWVQYFKAEKVLHFRLSCLAHTAQSQLARLIHEPLVTGTITSGASGDGVEQVAEFLKSSLLGLFYPHSQFNILVFPTKCEEWKMDILGQGPESQPSALGYFIFSSQVDCLSALPPASLPAPAVINRREESGANLPSSIDTQATPPRDIAFKRLFNFDYKRLLPTRRTPNIHNFFLVFPETKAQAMIALSRWLRACNSDCQIFISCQPGAWDAFRTAVDREPGVVIVHDTLTPTFRHFPNLSRYLIHKLDEYWCFTEPNQPQPFPSTTLVDDPSPLSGIQLTRHFSLRTAILLTPSFLVSQPLQAKEFLLWFKTKDKRGFNYRLVTAWNIHEYLIDLATEKNDARRDLYGSDSHHHSTIEVTAELRGLSSSDVDETYRAATLAAELNLERLEKAGLYDSEEDNSRLVYADRCIDPNDEQSLLNWFGWWATMRTEEFRKFYVVGSGDTMKAKPRRGERVIRIPRYSRATINDPDTVLEAFQQSIKESLEQTVAKTRTGPDVQMPRNGNSSGINGVDQSIHIPFRSDLVRSEEPQHISNAIREVDTEAGKNALWKLYTYAVAYDNWEMADHFRDVHLRFKRYKDWLDFAWEFNKVQSNGKVYPFNTYLGFFYTINTPNWDPNRVSRDLRQVPRHPWIVIYRVQNPHLKPITDCEVIIWDAHARQRYPGPGEPFEGDLLYMQRRVIELLRHEGSLKNRGSSIRHVWLGGFSVDSDIESPSSFDTTLQYLRRLVNNLRSELPLSAKGLAEKGFRRVQSGSGTSNHSKTQPDDNTEDVAMDLDSPSEDESDLDEDTRIIFHPPRGTKLKPTQWSRCTNKLYEDARLAKTRRNGGETMTYQFTPTTEWYNDQRIEGRGYEFINVDSWENVFRDLQVNKPPGEALLAGNNDRKGSATFG